MHLDMTNSTQASTVPVETLTVNTSRLTGIWPHLEVNRQLEMCLFASVDAKVSASMSVVFSPGVHSRPSTSASPSWTLSCPFPRDAVKMRQPPIRPRPCYSECRSTNLDAGTNGSASFPFALRNLPPARMATLEHSAKYSWAMCKCSDRRCRQLVVRRLDSTAT